MSEENKRLENKNEEEPNKEGMGFLGHLGELRKRLMWSVLGIVGGAIVAGLLGEQFLEIVILKLASDANLDLQNLRTMGQPLLFFKFVIYFGIIVSFPFTLYQLWKFVEPALYINEKKWVRSITFFTSLCFFSGVSFAYYVMIPSMLAFAASFQIGDIKNMIDIGDYMSFLSMMVLAAGIFFELPVVTYILARFGLVTTEFMKKYRRHSIVLILLIAAILTPSPDPVNQLIVAVPIYILYEISIMISKIAYKQYLNNS